MIRIFDLTGAPGIRGQSLGVQRRTAIRAWLEAWLCSLRDAGLGDSGDYLRRFLRETAFLPAIRAHAPDLLEEVSGVAAGAEIDLDLLLAAQLMDEEWAFRIGVLAGEARTKCSSIGLVEGPGVAWIGQNMDLGRFTDGHQLVLRIAGWGAAPGALVFSIGGMIGLMGVNACAVGVCVNALPSLPARREGLPVAFVIRRLLQARSGPEAVDLLQHLPHATSQHYLIAWPGGVRSFEASPEAITEFHPLTPGQVVHTNHPLALGPASEDATPFGRNTRARLASLTARLAHRAASLDILQEALGARDDPDFPVCRGGAGTGSSVTAFTTGSMIAQLDARADPLTVWMSAGPPCERGYASVALDRA